MTTQSNRRPKLFPPLALLAPAAGYPHHHAHPAGTMLSRQELRRIVADLLG